MNKSIWSVFLAFVVLTVLLSGCAPASTPPTLTFTPIQPTETPIPPTSTQIPPTATNTPSPLLQLQLDTLLVQAGDLPQGLTSAEIMHKLPELILDSAPNPDVAVFQEFNKGEEKGGSVTVFLYDDISNTQQAYDENSKSDTVSNVGEIASSEKIIMLDVSTGKESVFFVNLVFTRCHSVVYIQFIHPSNNAVNEVVSYAKKLDARLAEVVCLN